eukprot:5519719-Pyramimonas_sp.AAC.1
MPLDTDVIHDVPPELPELANKIRGQPFGRIPARGRRGRILSAVRGVIFLFAPAGITAAFPGCEVQRDMNYTNAALEARRDAHALGCRIRSAIESCDPHHEWAKGLGNEVPETARQNYVSTQEAIVFMRTFTELHFSVKVSLANSRLKFFSTDNAIVMTNRLKKNN